MANSILWGNSPEQLSDDSSSPVVTYSNIEGDYPGVGNINADPLFINPGNGDFHLGWGSPCIDAGDNGAAGLPSLDFEGDDRIVDGDLDGTAIVDMGADEAAIQADCLARINDDAAVYMDVQSAIDAASEGDLVKVAGYCAGVQSRVGLTQTAYISKTITLQGGYATTSWIMPDPETNLTTLDAQGLGRVLYITGVISPTIEGLRITGGSASDGGGVYVGSSLVTIHDSRIYGNYAHRGGGIHGGLCDLTITESTITENTAWQGGGLSLEHSTASLIGDVISSNNADYLGGGAWMYESDVALTANLISDNHAEIGEGDLFAEHLSTVNLVNSVVTAGQEHNSGIILIGSHALLTHTTLVGGDRGLVVHPEGTIPSTAVVINSIIVSHTLGITVTPRCTATLEGTLWHDNSYANWEGWGTIVTGTVNIFADPEFVDAAAGDYHIQPTSAAVDAGVDSGIAQDMDGDARPQGGGYDIGADETQYAASGTLNLSVDLQGRTDDSGTLFTAWSGGQEAGSCISGQDGTCFLPLAGGTYNVTAEMTSYLDSVWDTVSITEGESVTLPTAVLLGGDTNDDCVVNIQDLSFMGYRFNACEGDPLYDVRGDINSDGCVNILDLSMTGGNFTRTCPVPW